jgi:hypothetical protein
MSTSRSCIIGRILLQAANFVAYLDSFVSGWIIIAKKTPEMNAVTRSFMNVDNGVCRFNSVRYWLNFS